MLPAMSPGNKQYYKRVSLCGLQLAEASGGRTHLRHKVPHNGFEARAQHRPRMASRPILPEKLKRGPPHGARKPPASPASRQAWKERLPVVLEELGCKRRGC